MATQRVFTEEQVQKMRAWLAEFRERGGYEPDRWFVSPYNRSTEVVQPNFPKKVRIRDITLRVIEQMGIEKPATERRRFLVEMAKAGISEFVTSAFRRGHTVEEMRAEVEAVREVNPEAILIFGGANTPADVELAAEAGYPAVQTWMGPYLGHALPATSGAVYHRAWQGRDWSDLRFPQAVDDQVERVARLCDAAKGAGVRVGASILLLTYADDDYIRSFCSGMERAGAFDILLGDHASAVGPEAWTHICRLAKRSAPNCSISTHTHDMFGLATACTLAGLKGGADVAEVSVNGYTYGPMQANMAEVVGALNAVYGVETDADISQMTRLSRMSEEWIGEPMPRNQALTGTEVFDLGETGDEYTQEFKVDNFYHAAIEPEVVGNQRKVVLVHTTGPWTTWDILEDLGFRVTKEEVARAWPALREQAATRNRGLTDEEVREIASSVLNLTPTA